MRSFSYKAAQPADHAQSRPSITIKNFITARTPATPEVSPVLSNEQGSSWASTPSLNSENIVLANPAAMRSEETPINEDPLDVMDDDVMVDSPVFVWLMTFIPSRSQKRVG